MATHGHCINPRVNSVKSSPKRQGDFGGKCKTTDEKRRKKTMDGRNDANTEIRDCPRTDDLATSDGQSSAVLDQIPCVFCHSSGQSEGSGLFLAYAQGKEVTGSADKFSNVIHVHAKCLNWTPRIYFEDDIVVNLESEIIRANKLKCSSCGKKGASLGCWMKACQRTYHVPCAYDIPECRWDDAFLLLCPKHASRKFPSERKAKSGKQGAEKRISKQLNPNKTLLNAGKTLVLCGSGLSTDEKLTLVDFAITSGAVVSKYWRNDVTHVIAATDSDGACQRTQKVLMAILNGNWILTMEWVKACVVAGHIVKEEPYEVLVDIHGANGGPKMGRLRVQNNAPKLFNNLKFYFVGEFVQAYKADVVDLVITAGGTIIETKDQLLLSSYDEDTKEKMNQFTLVVYNADFSFNSGFEDENAVKARVLDVAEVLAQEVGCRVVPHIWILESIAGGLQLPIPTP